MGKETKLYVGNYYSSTGARMHVLLPHNLFYILVKHSSPFCKPVIPFLLFSCPLHCHTAFVLILWCWAEKSTLFETVLDGFRVLILGVFLLRNRHCLELWRDFMASKSLNCKVGKCGTPFPPQLFNPCRKLLILCDAKGLGAECLTHFIRTGLKLLALQKQDTVHGISKALLQVL